MSRTHLLLYHLVFRCRLSHSQLYQFWIVPKTGWNNILSDLWILLWKLIAVISEKTQSFTQNFYKSAWATANLLDGDTFWFLLLSIASKQIFWRQLMVHLCWWPKTYLCIAWCTHFDIWVSKVWLPKCRQCCQPMHSSKVGTVTKIQELWYLHDVHWGFLQLCSFQNRR